MKIYNNDSTFKEVDDSNVIVIDINSNEITEERIRKIIEKLNGKITCWQDNELYWLIKQFLKQQEIIDKYEKALKEIANEPEVGEGDCNADSIANYLIATANEALEIK